MNSLLNILWRVSKLKEIYSSVCVTVLIFIWPEKNL